MKKLFLLLVTLWALAAEPTLAQYSISQLPPATQPLSGADQLLVNQKVTATQYSTRQSPISGLAPFFPSLTSHYILQAADSTLTQSRTLTGTANEILLADGGPLGNLVLSTPQPIATTSSPTFAGITLTGLTGLLLGNGATAVSVFGGTSCVNQFIRSLSSSGAATCNSVANTDLVNSSVTFNGLTVALGASGTLQLASANFANQGTTTTVLHGNAAGNPSFSQVSLTADVTNVLPTVNGGTSFGTYTLGDTIYSSAANTLAKLSGNTTATQLFLSQTGTGAVSAPPTWSALPGSFSGFATPTGKATLTATAGAATTAIRSDANIALDLTQNYNWTGNNTYSAASGNPITVSSTGTNFNPIAVCVNGQTTNNRCWVIHIGSVGDFSVSPATDAGVAVGASIDISRSGTTTGAIALGGTSVTSLGPVAAAQVDMTPDTGTFTATQTGGTTAPTSTARWNRVGNMVMMRIPAFAAMTSNATTLTITGMPAAVVPANFQSGAVPSKWCSDNGAQVTNTNWAIGSSSNVVTLYNNSQSTTSWTNAAAAKGCTADLNIAYSLN